MGSQGEGGLGTGIPVCLLNAGFSFFLRKNNLQSGEGQAAVGWLDMWSSVLIPTEQCSWCRRRSRNVWKTAESAGLQLSLNLYLGYFGCFIFFFLLFAPETKFEFWRVIKRPVANSSSKTNLKLLLLPSDIWLPIEGPCAVNEILAIVQRTKLILSKRPVVNRRE